ncbi:sensor histidine kinase [Faecalicatena contorta]|uniref:GHKL domain-containing protein n=1 Tax=Faecalicatena contorta TaxID=39482 RepID=A0A316AGI7_9FIRM|nr:GHKL domain-containing protein [Faecalicatena contorta]PWJ48937.1 GHKL domain-containing protein [Faecalicatena contorta]SUQ15027.1 GHKL domain-containing protein [Faecalicatena contorta]
MQMLGPASLILYDVYILLYFKKILLHKRSHWIFYAAAIALNIGVTILSYLFLEHRFGVYLMMGSMMFAFHLLFKVNGMQILYAGSIYMFSLYSSRGIIMSVYSIILQISIKEILHNDIYYHTIFVLTVFLSMLVSLLIRKVILPDNKVKHLFNNRVQLRFVVIYLIFQLIFLTLINDGRYHNDIRQTWLSSLYLGSCVISKVWLMFVLSHTSRVSELLEYELHTHKLQEQLSRQVQHYQSYRKFTESYRMFRHDYEKLMTSVKTLLRNRKYEKAIRILDDIHDTMQRDVLVHKTYSDNILLDSILQDAANACEEKDIRFSVHVHLPESVSMTELDIVHVFSNIVDNAIEASDKVSDQERFVEIISRETQGWAIVEVANSFNGKLLIENDEPETTKDDKDYHGFGLRIAKKTIEALGGLLFIEPDQVKRIFKIRVCIPKVPSPYQDII